MNLWLSSRCSQRARTFELREYVRFVSLELGRQHRLPRNRASLRALSFWSVSLALGALPLPAQLASTPAAAMAPAPSREQSSTTAAPGATPSEPVAQPPRLLPPLLHAAGLLTAMRLTEAYLWPTPFAETSLQQLGYHYQQAYSRPPVWDSSKPLFQEDGDRWQINVIGHGLFGSELYLRARTCRLPAWQALIFAASASAVWEYGVEASGTRPSALDLTYTPLAGLVLGEARFQLWQAARNLPGGFARGALSTLVDPLGELERTLGSPC
jgi:hypothetical protein